MIFISLLVWHNIFFYYYIVLNYFIFKGYEEMKKLIKDKDIVYYYLNSYIDGECEYNIFYSGGNFISIVYL